ncbi:Na+/H+ antiporter NhaC [Microbulbifer hainanensis]|uniref:Na+/H+ antiporter NhaC n=1 Tax=Microbulbifer hainanensis TaxID=2735675 RepID=UPI001867721C|nr:Na+/H+ antiporter NhaC [Microbulbifer hainanensis]
MSNEDNSPTEVEGEIKAPSLVDALIPLFTLVLLIGAALWLFGMDALDGPIQTALIVCCMVTALIARKNGHSWSAMHETGRGALASITSAIFILLAVGALIGAWNLSGTIPTLVYYGIQVLSPSWYYVATALICGVIAMSIGSSWTTAGTIGVGLVGIAAMLEVSTVITAGAVVSGAYLGDKSSPLSETTIIAAQMVEVDVYTHIRNQLWTSLPAFLIALILFTLLGLGRVDAAGQSDMQTAVELGELNGIYHITAFNLLPLGMLVWFSVRKRPPSLALLVSALFAGVLGAFLQPQVYATFAGEDSLTLSGAVTAVWQAMANGFSMNSGIADVDNLLSRGGMSSMLLTVWLIIGAVTFGALLDEFGLIARLLNPLIQRAKSTGGLFLTVSATALGLNVVAGDQYIAVVLPTRIYRAEFTKRGLAPQNLSRLVADSGTVTSPLVPWNSCGAFMSAVLGVSTLLYLPFCFFNIASPLLSVFYGFTGFRVVRLEHAGAPETESR